VFDVPVLPHEDNTVLSLAGDIYDRKRIMLWVQQFCHRFKAVIIVLGNHDYWNGSYDLVANSLKQYIIDHKLTNVHILANDSITIDGVLYFGGTMWTNLNGGQVLEYVNVVRNYNDFNYIRTKNYAHRWSLLNVLTEHNEFISRLKQTLVNIENDIPVVVISHHAPTHFSVCSKYSADTPENQRHNSLYISDLDDLIRQYPCIKLWHHGHIHEKKMYKWVNGINVICNPRGYGPEDFVDQFDPFLTIDTSSFQLIQLMDN
jgi:DNA repair exonuclease SbcCD nuclease subunit